MTLEEAVANASRAGVGTPGPDVSAIVIAWNVRHELEPYFQSLRDHAGGLSVEPIYIDNEFTDGSADLVAERFPEGTIVRRPTDEGMPARNHGLRLAQGRYRMVLDSDARLTTGALRTAVDFLDANPEVGLVGLRLVYPVGRLQLSSCRFPPLALPVLRRPPLGRFFEDGPTVRRHLMAGVAMTSAEDGVRPGPCQIFRAAAQRAAAEFDPAIWHGPDDAHRCFSIRMAGHAVMYVSEAVVVDDNWKRAAARPVCILSLRMLQAHGHFQRTWWRQRRRLITEECQMDLGAEAIVEARC